MTSETLRKLLVAGAAVAALSVAACGQPAETTNTENTTVVENTTTEIMPADANAMPADANAMPADANAMGADANVSMDANVSGNVTTP